VKVDAFDFNLPEELIAQDAAPRGESRLLVIDRESGALEHSTVRDLPSFLRADDLLVTNDTKVFPARLLGHRVPSGGAVECLLVAREEPNREPAPAGFRSPIPDRRSPTSDLRPPTSDIWTALMHPGQKLKPGAIVKFESDAGLSRASGSESRGVLMAEVLERLFFGRRRIRLWAEDGQDVDALVDAMGHVPLPPYIHRPDTPEDRERYQTVFASARGSIAAPTAGLHFDAALVTALEAAGVRRATVTLHVGYGTFKPVRTDEVEAHVVDPEPYEISPEAAAAINGAVDEGRRVVAVGTTTTRALEDAARRAKGLSRASGSESRGVVRAGRAEAEIFIHPGFDFQVISGLMTNFHLPKSSLLMLVAAFAGRERVLAAYEQAVAQRYRFYSYGDAMLIL
jgi:S-adenosylmethionine:tRNA ribosyltransferase-isomerase